MGAQKMVDEEIGLRDRRTACLEVHLRMGRFAMAEIFERDLAGLADNRLHARQDCGEGGRNGQQGGLGSRKDDFV